MKIIFFGSAQFAVPCLRALRESAHTVLCVITQPDKKKGRGLHLEGTPVKDCAQKAGMQVYQPVSVNSPESVRLLRSFDADLFVVVAYGQILSQEVLDIPKLFAVNAHASLLPLYRGAAPINWALIRGEHITGVTIMKVIHKMDAGPVISAQELAIDVNDDDSTLEEKLSLLAAGALVKSITDIERNTYSLDAQDESKATFAPKLKKQDGLIDWNKPAREIAHLVRGCIVWPGAFTHYKGKLVKIYKAQVVPQIPVSGHPLPGQIKKISKENIIVSAGDNDLLIEELQIEGKRRMGVEEFIAGHKMSAGDRLG